LQQLQQALAPGGGTQEGRGTAAKDSAEANWALQISALEAVIAPLRKASQGESPLVKTLQKELEEVKALRDEKRKKNMLPWQIAKAQRQKLEAAERKARVAGEEVGKTEAAIKKLQEQLTKQKEAFEEAKNDLHKAQQEAPVLVDTEDSGIPGLECDESLLAGDEGLAKEIQELQEKAKLLRVRVSAKKAAAASAPSEEDEEEEGDEVEGMDTSTADGAVLGGNGGEEGGEGAGTSAAGAGGAEAPKARKPKMSRPSVWLSEDKLRELLDSYGVEATPENIDHGRNFLDAGWDEFHPGKKPKLG